MVVCVWNSMSFLPQGNGPDLSGKQVAKSALEKTKALPWLCIVLAAAKAVPRTRLGTAYLGSASESLTTRDFPRAFQSQMVGKAPHPTGWA